MNKSNSNMREKTVLLEGHLDRSLRTVVLEEEFDCGSAPGTRLSGKVPPTTFQNMDEPLQKVHKWYALLGTPTRDEMKAKIAKNPQYYGVTPDMVDLLPWNGASKSRWSYIQKNTDFQHEDRRKDMEDRLQKQKALKEDQQRKREQEMRDRLAKQKEERRRKEAEEAEKRRQLEEKERKLEELRERQEAEREAARKEAERRRKEADDARRRLEKCIKDLTAFSATKQPSNEKKELDDALDETKDWLDATPIADKEDYEEKQERLEALAKKLRDAEEARRRKDAEEARRRLEKCVKDLAAFSKNKRPSDEKRELDDALDDTRDWLDVTPIADKEDYEEKQDELEELARNLRYAEETRKRKDAMEARKRLEKCVTDLTAFSENKRPSNEKKELDNALDDTKDWLDDTSIADKEDYEEKQDILEELAKKLQDAEEARRRKDAEEARKRLEKCVKDLTAFSKDKRPSDEKKKLDNALDDTKDWLDDTPIAEKEDYEEKQDRLEALAKELEDAEEARRRQEAEKARRRLANYCDDLKEYIKDVRPTDAKDNLENAIDDTLDWLDSDPQAEKEDYDAKYEEIEELERLFMEAEEELLRKDAEEAERRRKEEEERLRREVEAERRRKEAEEAERRRRKEEERRRREQEEREAAERRRREEEEARLRDAEDDEEAKRLRKLEEYINSRLGKRKFVDEQKKTQFLRDTRLLMAYRWWYRFSCPNKKDMTRKVMIGDMKEADVYPEDVALLPWLYGGFTVDVAQMLEWISSLDPNVTETVEMLM